MPHKDRTRRLGYLDSYRAKHRPSPTIQERDGLPPIGAMEYNEDGSKVRCHACGRWFSALNMHLRTHGLDKHSYKETYGLKRTASLLPPIVAEKYAAATIARGQGEIGRDSLPRGSRRPVGLEPRLQARVEASRARKGINTRAGERTRS